MKIAKFLMAILFSTLLGGVLAATIEVSPAATIFPLIGVSMFTHMPSGVFGMAFQTEAWTRDVQEQLFSKVFGFIRNSVNHDAFVNNKTVHVPQGGSIGNVEKNRAVLPATISQRTDTDLTYDLNNYTTDPIVITNLEAIQASYNKRNSVLNQHINKINSRIAEEVLISWAATTTNQIIACSGAATANITPPSGVGNRTLLTPLDLSQGAAKLDEQEVPQQGRYLAIPSKMYWSFVEAHKAFLLNMDYNRGITDADMALGVVSKVYGWNIIPRGVVTVYKNAAVTPNAVGAAAVATDRFGAVGWHQDFVCNALGSVKTYYRQDDPTFFGDVLSAEVNHGSAKSTTAMNGIVTFVQS